MDLVCFSHLPWNFVYQRPQHLLSRFAPHYRVFYYQEPGFHQDADTYTIDHNADGVRVIVPMLDSSNSNNMLERQRAIVDRVFRNEHISNYILWYYTPMSLLFSEHLAPQFTVYDCMDELSAFKFADPQLKQAENLLFKKADVVFTGGNTLFEAKKGQHPNVHSFPSSIDKNHFAAARRGSPDPADQAAIPHPRLGFYGVIDERFDIDMIAQAAELQPTWQFVLIGPVVKIDPAQLPRRSNIHYIGSKTYKELPTYLAGWDIALIPFAINESTRFISPTKTPEYLAAGKPVISSPITDVVYPYGKSGLVHIVSNGTELVEKATEEFASKDKAAWLRQVDEFLAENSWDNTWARMHELIKKKGDNQHLRTNKKEAYV